MVNLRSSGALRGKWRIVIVKGGECDVENWDLQGCSPRLCRLRIIGLVPVSKYWKCWSHAGVMGPVSLVARHQQVLDFSSLLHWLLWERSWVRTHRSISRRAVNRDRSPFSRGQWIHWTLLTTTQKVAMPDRMRYIWLRAIRGLSAGCVWRVDQVSPAECKSFWITATLRYE
jgi:hypothetical protein